MRWRRKKSRTSSTPLFEGINITPFTDILLVLLIIFMIAGSSLAPTGVELKGLVVGEVESVGAVEDRLEVWISAEGAVRYESGGQDLSVSDVDGLVRNTPTVLMVAPRASVDSVVQTYDRLLQLGFTQVSFGPPAVKTSRDATGKPLDVKPPLPPVMRIAPHSKYDPVLRASVQYT